MPLTPGAQIGSYQITSLLGSGGMGEVYRATDRRLLRDVAIKVLRADFAPDAQQLSRFEQEARAAAALDHPNVLAVHELGLFEGSPFIVSEVLDGTTLRELMADGRPVPSRKAIEYAVQVARGLAAAHARGIVHRDLKPENIFVTRDGHVKILDFGLAKLTQPPVDEGRSLSPTAAGTQPGLVLGTVTYMSPEQVRGQSVDGRSDIFALGAILYEMLSGKRAFARDTAADTMGAILSADPADLTTVNPGVPPALDRIVHHCLEKAPEQRFQSTRDLAFALEALSSGSGTLAAMPPVPARRMPWWVWAAAAVAVPLLVLGLVSVTPRRTAELPVYDQMTFREGGIVAARFAADGHTIVYSAAWRGSRPEIFSIQHGTDALPSGLTGADLLSLSPSGDLAVSLNRKFRGGFLFAGTLAQVAVGSGPREILENVQAADWSPDGSSLAIVHDVAGRAQLEYPLGHVLYATSGWISHPRVAPGGDRVAFIDHPYQRDDAGSIDVVDRSGHVTVLAAGFSTAQGVAWSGREVWFTAAKTGVNRDVFAVTLDGKIRPVASGPGLLTLMDVSRDGRALVTADRPRLTIFVSTAAAPEEHDLSWLDWSRLRSLSDDGKAILFDETGQGGGEKQGVYIRTTDGAPAVRLGDGVGEGLSPDGKWALSTPADRARLVLLPTGPGESRVVQTPGLKTIQRGYWFPDGKHLLLAASEPGQGTRFYMQDLVGGRPVPITPTGMVLDAAISPDGGWVAAHHDNGQAEVFSTHGGPSHPISGVRATDNICRWTADGQAFYVYDPADVPLTLYRIDAATGRRDVVKTIPATNASPLYGISYLFVTPDLKSYAYCASHEDSTLYVVRGLK